MQGGPITGINVTPLVDITLVLLIIFMVTARLIVSRQALPVDLPPAVSGQRVPLVFGLVLRADGTIEIDGKRLSDDDAIIGRARAALGREPELRAVIEADVSVPHGRVMHALDLLRRAGISKIGLGVVPPASPSPGPRGAT